MADSSPSWWRPALAVLVKECRCLLRDPHTVVYSLLVPVFLYPLLVWAVVQGVTYARGIGDRATSTIHVAAGLGAEDAAGEVIAALLDEGRVEVVRSEAAGEASDAHDRTALTAGQADAVVRVWSGAADDPRLDAQIDVLYSSVRDGSKLARARAEEAVREVRERRLETLASSVGGDAAMLDPVTVESENRSSEDQMARHVAALLLPILMLVMTALGALYPALDVTVGERERGTLETTLLAPGRRGTIVLGKYGAVVLFSLAAFLLNLTSLTATLFHQGSVLELPTPSVGAGALAVIVLASVLLAGSLSAVMMFLAFQARTFKEGQSYVTPVYILAALPAIALAAPEIEPGAGLALVPILNIALLFREAIEGTPPLGFTVLVLGSSVVYAGGFLAVAAWWLQRTEVVAGGGGLRAIFARGRTAADDENERVTGEVSP